MKPETKTVIKKRILPTALIALSVPFVLFFTVPFEIFVNNSEEFVFSAVDFLPILAGICIGVAAVFFSAFLFLPKLAYKICCNVYLALAFMFFVQGIYLNRNMSGFSTNGSGGNSKAWQAFNFILWLAFIGAGVGVSFIKDKKEIVKTVSVILSVVILATQSVGFVKNSVTHGEAYSSKLKTETAADGVPLKVLTDAGLAEVSKNKNVLYFCFDRFDEFFAESARRHAPEIFGSLDGFTAFNDNVSLYGHTYPSIAYMLTNKRYEPQKRRNEFLNEVYRSDDTLSVLAENGYKTSVYTQRYYAYNLASGMPDYIANASELRSVEVLGAGKIAMNLIRMSLFRCLPVILKDSVGILTANQCNRNVKYTGEDGFKEYGTENADVCNRIKEQNFSEIDENVFKFVHLNGCHNSMATFEDYDVTASGGKEGILAEVRSSMAVVELYINRLKEIGAYKDATIIITGDHPCPFYDESALGGVKLTGLLVKPAGEEGTPFKVSEAPVSHGDIWPTIMRSAGLELPSSYDSKLTVFDADKMSDEERAERERTFVWHTYMYSNSMDVYNYKVKGSGKDFANWSVTDSEHFERGIMH